ncbi:hypothetical protein B0H13DRAFT_2332786 [Mycena leptocephala]|nr:hypothetical protein B0H13DRAFT_2332786 [Mycena leptocephala]
MSDPPDTSLHDISPFLQPTNTIINSPNLTVGPTDLTEAVEDAHVTLRNTRSRRQRDIQPIPDNANILHHPKSPQHAIDTLHEAVSPHHPAPQIRVVKKKQTKVPTENTTSLDLNPPEVTLNPGASRVPMQGDDQGKRGGACKAPMALGELPPLAGRQATSTSPSSPVDRTAPSSDTLPKKKRDSAKQEKYESLQEKATAAGSLDDLATILRETVATMRLYSTSAPTKACLKLLDEIQERLTNHHEFPSTHSSSESFSSIVTRSVVSPVKSLAAQVESQHKAIQSLAKTVETLKNAPLLMSSPPASPSPSYAKAAGGGSHPKPKPPPLPNPSDERLLILDELNTHLVPRGLPKLAYTQRYLDYGIFLVPATGKEGVAVLAEQWKEWGPSVLPGGRIVPVAMHTTLQVDGVPFSGVGSLDDLKREFEEHNPSLGKVVGIPRWVNKPPSEARIAAILVDRTVAAGRVILAGTAPAYSHTHARCSTVDNKCGGCGSAAHGISCAEKPSCINCSGAHRSDSFSCPARKRIAENLRQHAADLCASLDAQSRFNPHFTSPKSSLSPLPSSLGLADFTPLHTPLAPRLPEHQICSQ